MRRLALTVSLASFLPAMAAAHDIPNARVDRSIQATLGPARLAIEYEVSLAELTLTQELRSLIGVLPGADRRDWFLRYGEETGPMNAKGLLVTVDGLPLALRSRGFDLAIEEHPRYTFHLEADPPSRGRLVIQDTNFASSEGTSRLALRGREGVIIRGDDLPTDVDRIEAQPVWQLSDLEERRTKGLDVDYVTSMSQAEVSAPPPDLSAQRTTTPQSPVDVADRISMLLDGRSGLPFVALWLVAFGLGVAHAVQPGHGKTLVAATVLGERGSWPRGTVLAVVTTLTHTSVVLLIAGGLWWTGSMRYGAIHSSLARVAGFAIAALGLWRLGRHLAGYGEHDEEIEPRILPLSIRERVPGGRVRVLNCETETSPAPPSRTLVGLGVAGGLVPCWDAISLIVVAHAVGRLALGVLLLLAFSLGMAVVLIAVGWAATRLRRLVETRDLVASWERALGTLSGLLLTAIGIFILTS